jgi:lipase ATG15
MNSLAKTSLDKIAFYKLTTKFANELKSNPNFAAVQVTGHSLGGGLSLITGAQAKIPAIGLSAPNTLISGGSFDPVVTEDDLNRYTFNIIPNQDMVPKLDDVAANYQYINCTKPVQTGFIECHFGIQSLCEIQYTCGSGNRPVLCECFKTIGYPRPSVREGFADEMDDFCVGVV